MLTDQINAGLSNILVKIALPSTVFMSMMRPFSRTLLMESIATLFISAGIYLSGYVIGIGLARLMGAGDDEKRVWQFSLAFANVGYMGFPIVEAVYGYEGMIYTSMANVSFSALIFSLGVYLFKKKGTEGVAVTNLKTFIFSPPLAATYIGFFLFVTGLRLPETIEAGVGSVRGMTTPLAMILVGSILAKSTPLDLISDLRVIPVIFVRLLGIPAAAFFILRPFLHNSVMLEVIVILAAMPVAAFIVVFAEMYKGNTVMASKMVALSSLLCLLSIPLIALLLQ
jgi:predicted permease